MNKYDLCSLIVYCEDVPKCGFQHLETRPFAIVKQTSSMIRSYSNAKLGRIERPLDSARPKEIPEERSTEKAFFQL